MRKAQFPIFVVDHVENSSFRLSYKSSRGTALAALVEGVLPEVARCVHSQLIDMEREEIPRKEFDVSWSISTRPMQTESMYEMGRGRVEESSTQATTKDSFEVHPAAARWHFVLVSAMRSCFSKSVKIVPSDKNIVHSEKDIKKYLDRLKKSLMDIKKEGHEDAQTDMRVSQLLMRVVEAGRVSCEWTNEADLDRAASFWGTFNIGDTRHFHLSRSAKKASCFVSHAWSEPEDWIEKMGSRCSYAEMKAAELAIVAKDRAEESKAKTGEPCDWRTDVTFWVGTCVVVYVARRSVRTSSSLLCSLRGDDSPPITLLVS